MRTMPGLTSFCAFLLSVTFVTISAHAAESSAPRVAADAAQSAVLHLASSRKHIARSRGRRESAPGVRSSSVLVVDEATAAVMYSKQPDVALPIASISKLMTALVVLEGKQPLDEELQITKEDRDSERHSASRLAPGTKLSRGDLLHLALMSSENRAAHALARNYPGGERSFVAAMNSKARALGMTATHFNDPTGLSSENIASAQDLYKLVVAASHSSLIREYSTDESYAVRVGRRDVEFRNTNSLVSNPSWDIAVQKTGFTNDAGECLVMKATIQERPVVMVFLNSFGKYTRVADARRIRKWMESNPQVWRVASSAG